ncbi:MAG: hypothetical protein ABIP55_06555 [Tepidisphaeraceae bacterium]
MSRLDRQIAMVRGKLTLQRFLQALVKAQLVFLCVFWVAVAIDRVYPHLRPPHYKWYIWGAVGVAALGAAVYTLLRRPTRHEAAVAIDQTLGLKEKFSTALFARSLSADPFAQAAVKDAERTADNTSLHNRFPLRWPRRSVATALVAALVAVTLALPRTNLFAKPDQLAKSTGTQKEIEQIRKDAMKQLQVVVDAQARGVADEETINQAKRDLEQLINAPIKDPEKARRSAARALSDLDQAVKSQMANNQRVADSESDAKAFKSLTPPSDEKGPVAEAQRKIAKAEFSEAVDELSKAVDKFDKLTEPEQKKAAEQMQKMAQQLQQMAQDPKVQQQLQQQMQQMGMNQQQAQQVAKQMQQAAAGDKQAQQQLQQQANAMMKQMNNGQGPNQQQQQQIQQMMKQAQAQANTQAQAQQMAQAAQQMAQAMQQAQQGNKGGQQQGQQNAQQMAQAMQQMNQQLGQMQAMKADAQQMQAMQNQMNQAAQQAAGACNNPGAQGGQQAGQGKPGQWANNNQGQWQQGDNRQFKGPNQGMGGAGIGAGDRSFKEQAPYTPKEEMSPSQDIEGGKILASTLIKAQSLKGQSKVTAQTVAPPPEQEATDEIEQERISRPAQQAVKEYFSAWQKDAAQ